MSKEVPPLYHGKPDITQKSGGNIVSDTSFDIKGKTNTSILPSDRSGKPDVLSDIRFSEKQQLSLVAATRIVSEVIEGGKFDEHLEKLQTAFPLTYDHSVKAGIISSYLANYLELPDTMQYMAAEAGVNHDIGKILHLDTDWDSYNWSPEEIQRNSAAVLSHSQDSARLIRVIDGKLELPVLLHHAFQVNPYPNIADYLDDLSEQQLTVVRFIALADQTEAVFTRTRENGRETSDEQMIAHLRTHMLGESQPAFSEEEMLMAISAYRMMERSEYPKAA